MTEHDATAWSFDPFAYSKMCRTWHLERQALPPAFERYRLAVDVDDKTTIQAHLDEMLRFWTDRRDSGLGEIFETFITEHQDFQERLLDPVQRVQLRADAAASKATDTPLADAIQLPASPLFEPSSQTPSFEATPTEEPLPELTPSEPPRRLDEPHTPTLDQIATTDEPAMDAPQSAFVLPGFTPPAVVAATESSPTAAAETPPDAPPPIDPPPPSSLLELPPLPNFEIPRPPQAATAQTTAVLEAPALEDVGGGPLYEAADETTTNEARAEPDVDADAEPEAEPEPFDEPPIGELHTEANGNRINLRWSSANGPVKITRSVLQGDLATVSDLGIPSDTSQFYDRPSLPFGTVLRYELRRVQNHEISHQALVGERVILCEPLADVEVLAGDRSIRLQWRGAAGAERVEVERRTSDDDVELDEDATSPLNAFDLVNGRRYTLVLRAFYRDANGELVCCEEARRQVRPIPAPAAPEDVQLDYEELAAADLPRVARVHYPAPQSGRIQVYVARQEPIWTPGTAVDLEDLANLEGPLPAADPGLSGRQGVRFEGKRYGVTYFVPFAELGLHRIVGQYAFGLDCEIIRNLSVVRDNEANPGAADEQLQMTWDWPGGGDRVRILWRHDQPPTNKEDTDAERLEINAFQFMKQQRQVTLPLPKDAEEVFVLMVAGVPYSRQDTRHVFFVPRYGPSARLTWRRGGHTVLRFKVDIRQGYSGTSAPEGADLIIRIDGAVRPLPEMVLLSADRRQPLRNEVDNPLLTTLVLEANAKPRFPIRQPIPLAHVSTSRRYNLVFKDPEWYKTWKIENEDQATGAADTAPLF